jgi:hypothetical protein
MNADSTGCTARIVVVAIMAILELLPFGVAITIIRRRSVALLIKKGVKRDPRAIEGPAIAAAGWVALLILGLLEGCFHAYPVP